MSTDEERICSIALTQIPGVGHIGAKRLVDGMGSAADVFRYRTELPDRLPGVNQAVVAAGGRPAFRVAGIRKEVQAQGLPQDRGRR